jgi:N-acetylglutamate synthase-like GNAT family acetyltransferase
MQCSACRANWMKERVEAGERPKHLPSMRHSHWRQPTLERFLRTDSLRNEYVKEPDFEGLYVRKSHRQISVGADKHYPGTPMLDIANVTVAEKKRGTGVFTRLVQRIRAEHPTLPIYVENVLDPRFGWKLEKLGFEPVGTEEPRSYIWWPEEKDRARGIEVRTRRSRS